MAAPFFTNLNNTPVFTEDGPRVVLDNDVSLTDPDSDPYNGATLTLARSGGANPDDVFDGSGTLQLTEGQVLLREIVAEEPIDIPVGSFVLADGQLVITFDENATAARVNAVLRQLTYANGNQNPPASVQINYAFFNGDLATGSITVGITAANDTPALDFVAGSASYQPSTSGAPLSPNLVVADLDTTTLVAATVRIVDFVAGDALSADTSGTGIGISYNAGTGILTLSGTRTLAQYQQVLRTVAYSSTSVDPGMSRTIEWQLNDGQTSGNLSAVQTTILQFLPGVDLDRSAPGSDFAAAFKENGTAVPIADSDALVTSGSAAQLMSAKVILTNASAGDMLSISGSLPGGISASVDTSNPGVIIVDLTGLASAASYRAALQQIVFSNSSDTPATTPRDITVFVTDEAGVNSNTAHTIVAENRPPNDFNGDGMSDVLLRSNSSRIATWEVDGSQVIDAADFGAVSSSWKVAGTGDFNGDGTSDILWRNSDGRTATWEIDGDQIIGAPDFGIVSNAWQTVGVGDFNGDGMSDILWRKDTGQIALWLLDGDQIIGAPGLGLASIAWQVAGTGDFNDDGIGDILWRHANGQLAIWTLDEDATVTSANLAVISPSWKNAGIGDFNGDGTDDLLWRNDNGQVAIWELNGNQIIGAPNLGVVNNTWIIEDIGDFNGDATSDILLRHANGHVATWQLDDSAIINAPVLGPLSPAWDIIG